MILHWLSTAWRSLVSNPLFSAITIVSLSIGCCGAVLAGSNILQHLTFERGFADADRILMVTRKINQAEVKAGAPRAIAISANGAPLTNNPTPTLAMPMKAVLAGAIDGIEAQTRLIFSVPLTQADKDEADDRAAAGGSPQGSAPARPVTAYVDEDFFKVFPMPFVEGSGDGLQQIDAVILTQSRARNLFGEAPAVGKTIPGVKGHELKVVGVVRDLPANTHMAFEVLAGLRTYQLVGNNVPTAFESDWARASTQGIHYIRLKPDTDVAAFIPTAANKMKAAYDQGFPARPSGVSYDWSALPLPATHLAPPEVITFTAGNLVVGDLNMIWALGLSAIALMIISGFNYVTLSLARNLRRQREVAVRKVMGAGKGAIVRHYMAESAFMTAIAMAFGFGLAELLHPWFARGIGQPEVMFGLYTPQFLTLAAISYVVLVLTVGAYPALYLGGVRPQTGLGEGPAPMPGRFGRLVSSGLLGIQLAAAAMLVIVSVTMAAQANFLSNRFLGFEVKDRYVVSLPCPPRVTTTTAADGSVRTMMRIDGPMMAACIANAKTLIGRTPGIRNVGFYAGGMLEDGRSPMAVARSSGGEQLGTALEMSVDPEFLETVGARLLAGRFLSNSSAYDRSIIDWRAQMDALGQGGPPELYPPRPTRMPVVVSRAMLPVLGVAAPEDAIGKTFAAVGSHGLSYDIVGVVEDWHQRPLKYQVQPMVFMPEPVNNIMAEVAPENVDATREALRAGWREMIGNPTANAGLSSLEEKLSRAYRADFQLMWALIGFSIVAIVVAGMGVYGLSAFEMRRRVREIGIRKALGASPGKVASAVIGQALVFAGLATLIAWPVGWWLSQQWLTGFVYRTPLSLAVLPAATVAVIAFVGLAVGLNALRAAAIRPNVALRTTG